MRACERFAAVVAGVMFLAAALLLFKGLLFVVVAVSWTCLLLILLCAVFLYMGIMLWEGIFKGRV